MRPGAHVGSSKFQRRGIHDTSVPGRQASHAEPMHVLEKAATLCQGLHEKTRQRFLGEETLVVQLCNGTDTDIDLHNVSNRSNITTSFVKLQPGQVGTSMRS